MKCAYWASRLGKFLWLKEEEPPKSFTDEELLLNAHEELQQARNIFSLTDPEFIDYAVYNLRAAEERYNSLVKQIKRKAL